MENPFNPGPSVHRPTMRRQRSKGPVGDNQIMSTTSISVEKERETGELSIRQCIVDVCTSCRTAGTPREPKENRPGYMLFRELRDAVSQSPLKDRVVIRSAACLSVCPRPCGIALSQPYSWTYIFGDQQPTGTAQDILDCVSTYLRSADGFMPRKSRPKSLRASILGRVPPLAGTA